MAADINVKRILLLESYQKSFNGFSSASLNNTNSYLSLLSNCSDRARQIKSRIQSIAERRKSYLNNARIKLAAVMIEKPLVPSHIIAAKKRLDGCDEAYKTAKQYYENCERMYKKLLIEVEQAKQQCLKFRSELSETGERGDGYLKEYICKLKDYSQKNG